MQGRFLQLLVTLLALLLIYPFLENLGFARTLMNIFLTFTLVSALFSVSENKRSFKRALLLFLLAVGGVWLAYFAGGDSVLGASPILVTGLFAFAAARILNRIIRSDEVTAETIYGALCVYLLLGLLWAMLYATLESVLPGSLTLDSGEPVVPQCIYYSYVTLTTLGYGDVTPVSGPARSLSFVEALAGQMYLAVLIARLVGLHIAHASRK